MTKQQKIENIKQDIKILQDTTYDIDREHHEERIKILENKKEKLKSLIE